MKPTLYVCFLGSIDPEKWGWAGAERFRRICLSVRHGVDESRQCRFIDGNSVSNFIKPPSDTQFVFVTSMGQFAYVTGEKNDRENDNLIVHIDGKDELKEITAGREFWTKDRLRIVDRVSKLPVGIMIESIDPAYAALGYYMAHRADYPAAVFCCIQHYENFGIVKNISDHEGNALRHFKLPDAMLPELTDRSMLALWDYDKGLWMEKDQPDPAFEGNEHDMLHFQHEAAAADDDTQCGVAHLPFNLGGIVLKTSNDLLSFVRGCNTASFKYIRKRMNLMDALEIAQEQLAALEIKTDDDESFGARLGGSVSFGCPYCHGKKKQPEKDVFAARLGGSLEFGAKLGGSLEFGCRYCSGKKNKKPSDSFDQGRVHPAAMSKPVKLFRDQ
jgi:hypothetical protein